MSFDDSAPANARLRSQLPSSEKVVSHLKRRGYTDEQARRIARHAAARAAAAR
jgi:SOS response regulatory protein OraA/RecX